VSNPLALIVEDDADATVIFQEALQAAGFETESVDTGTAAAKRLTQIVPAVVVLDLHLPGVGGTTILDQIRSDPKLASTQVIVITGDSALADNPKLQAAAVQILVKPVTYTRLRDLARLLMLSIKRAKSS
jgi:CheY-like chemotaxis protein